MQLLAVPALVALVLTFFSFTAKDKDIVNGGGIATPAEGGDAIHFNFTAVQSESGVVGHFTWNSTTYDITCLNIGEDGEATIYLSLSGVYYAVDIDDNKHGTDIVTAPYLVDSDECDAAATETPVPYEVTEGNLTVHK